MTAPTTTVKADAATGALTGTAPAKVNLTLLLTGLRNDGYHLLESLVVFAAFGDKITVRPSDTLSLTVDGPFAAGVPTDESNLVLKAATRLANVRKVSQGAAIHLTKSLPHGGGIGGGSSDAACAIKLLSQLWGVRPLTSDEALPLGADVPVCLRAPDAIQMRGIGEVLSPAPYQPQGWLVLVNPGAVVPTGSVFKLHDTLYDFSPADLEPMDWVKDLEDFETWLLGQRNDLTKVARETEIAPIVGDVIDALRPFSRDCDMSGSGSTCWGWFTDETQARDAAAQIKANHQDWWVQPTRILP